MPKSGIWQLEVDILGMNEDKRPSPIELESGDKEEKLINLQDFKHGDKYLTRNGKTAVLWRQWHDINHNQFFAYGEIGKMAVGVKTGVWDENGKCVYNDKKKELQNDPALDLVKKIEKMDKK